MVNPTWIGLEPDENDNNMRATTIIPNHSVVTFELVSPSSNNPTPPQLAPNTAQGNTTFHNYLLGKEVGTVFIDNLTLRPGMNEYPMRATVDNGAVIDALGKKPYCEQKGVLPFEIRGKTVVNHGQPLPYFADALGAYTQPIEIPIGAAVNKSLGVVIPCGGLGGGGDKRSSLLF